ncbi:Maf family protein [Vibrio alfacsensis]|uniref:Maf family protein n=1 Tax=Vibrio alfacsensis TaxID=1074311 RepID=UPI002ADDE064|nr:Maf family protein [Vibrio alfacsensis]WQE75896.1 Maf family protein [Vibrio alfacsensis]
MKKGLSLVLASGSPRRKELLAQLGYDFDVVLPDIEEAKQDHEQAQDYVLRLSLEKAQAGLAMAKPDSAVLGSDTVVVCENQVLEKPKSFEDSKRMLNNLSGRQHQVMTAVSVVSKEQQHSVVVITDVWFKTLTEEEIEQYWQSGEPCDKAGSYGIQGLGGRFVTRIEGSYHAVVGLPLFETDQLIQEFL